jgi:hypothetical protein
MSDSKEPMLTGTPYRITGATDCKIFTKLEAPVTPDQPAKVEIPGEQWWVIRSVQNSDYLSCGNYTGYWNWVRLASKDLYKIQWKAAAELIVLGLKSKSHTNTYVIEQHTWINGVLQLDETDKLIDDLISIGTYTFGAKDKETISKVAERLRGTKCQQ